MSRFWIDGSGQWSGGGRVVLDNLAEAAALSDVLSTQPSEVGIPLIPRNVPVDLTRLARPFVWMPQNALPWGPTATAERSLQRKLWVASSLVATRATAMIRISGAIPPLKRRPTSKILHNVLDRGFEDILENLKPEEIGAFFCAGSAHSYRVLPSLLRGYVAYREGGGRKDLVLLTSPGTPSEEAAIACAGARVPGVRLIGGGAERGRVAALMAGSAGVIFPSTVEASPVTVLEARALGKPVACSQIPAHLELSAQEDVVSFRAGDVGATARALHTLDDIGSALADPLQSRSQRSGARATWCRSIVTFLERVS